MKKILLSLCLLGVVAPQATQAVSFSSIKEVIIGEKVQKIALVSLVAFYFFKLKKRKPVDVEDRGKWAWSNVITKFGEEDYVSKELIGNFKREKETELTTVIDTDTFKAVKDKETITEAYGLIGTLDAIFISKLKDFAELLKSIKELKDFANNPFSLF